MMSEIEPRRIVRSTAPHRWRPVRSRRHRHAPKPVRPGPDGGARHGARSGLRQQWRQLVEVGSDADTFKSSVNKLIDDVTSGNFGDAKSQLSTVKSDFQALRSSAKKLASSKKSSVQSDLDAVKSTLDGLSSATSLSDVQSTLGTAQSQLTKTADSITTTLSC
jgi:hypothetical protein